jgi:hypothetical protein
LAPAKKEGTPEDPSIALTDEELDLPALRYLKDGTMIPAGMGQNGVALRTKVIKRANYLRKAAGLSGDIAANAAQMKADAKSFSTLQTQADGLRAFENTALANAKQLLAASDKVPDTGSPFVNDLVRTAAKGFLGSDQVSNFQSAMEPVNAEFARILQSGGSLGGQLTDTARKDMRSVMSGNFTRKQLRGSLAILERDAENRRKAYADQLGIIRARMMWGAMLVNGPGQQPPAQPPPSGDWFDQNSPEAGK